MKHEGRETMDDGRKGGFLFFVHSPSERSERSSILPRD
jgi:hypothetical protein